MHFTNPRSINRSTNIPVTSTQTANIAMNIFQLPKPKPKPNIQQTTVRIPEKKDTMLWGAPTWYFFHTLAEKIKPEHFEDNKSQRVSRNSTCPCGSGKKYKYCHGRN